ncbi:Dyp-type peroxidase [Actinoplanes regularis]|uniref:Dyp-type peroxidase n=1 Tax=Actinoplanes regularis TaxID=52697 RepID=UPI0024A0AB53|nr:Dyp-type peroxidase [Actinoplanes regularis]GLW29244.1 peroxidase [Actinoplanes regularis]
MTPLEKADVQGLVVSGYARMHHARYVMLRVNTPTAARRRLVDLAERLTTAERAEWSGCVNVAFTGTGLAALGLRADELDTFAAPFREGMVLPHRQRLLGDTGPSAPSRWQWGHPGRTGASAGRLHVLLLLFAADEPDLQTLDEDVVGRLTVGGAFEVVHTLNPEPLPGTQSLGGKFGVEHFGFADGMSQPVIAGTGQETGLGGDEARRQVVATGEFVLGYANGYGRVTPSPTVAGTDFGRNGTYLVVRQLAQDVAGFNRYLAEATGDDTGVRRDEAIERLAAKLVGRWRSGTSLVRSPHRDDVDLAEDNGFGFAEVDPDGERCPIGAHTRRANPRDGQGDDAHRSIELANLHRIVRRGRVYGPAPRDPFTDDGRDRGLIFICVNANIDRQFEFIQHTWLNNRHFGGLYDEQDPLLGAGGTFTVPQEPVAGRIHGIPNFVTTRGGAYFFLPGVAALRCLGLLSR